MHKAVYKIVYKDGYLEVKELPDIFTCENIVIFPWMEESVILMEEDKFQELAEKMQSMGEHAKHAMRRIFAQAFLMEVEDGKVMLSQYCQEWMKLEGQEAILEASHFEKNGIKGIQIQVAGN